MISWPAEKIQRWAVWMAVGCAVLGLGASAGCAVVPKGPPSAAWLLHPLVMGLGAAAGVLTLVRKREIDRVRWQVVQDTTITKGEREYAHREAERDIRIAGTTFLAAALSFGYWMAYQFNVEDEITAAEFLIVSPLAGYLAGLLSGRKIVGEEE